MKSDARTWFREALEILECEHLEREVAFHFNERFSARLGDARYRDRHGRVAPRIRLSAPLWPRVSDAERKETVVHETCHVVQLYEAYKAGKRVKPHGKEWQYLMRKCGYEPKVTHDVDTAGVKNSRKTARVYCRCPEPAHAVTPRLWERVAMGRRYTCRTCKARLTTKAPERASAVEPVKPRKTKSERLSDYIRKVMK